jgi:hypothetical protein
MWQFENLKNAELSQISWKLEAVAERERKFVNEVNCVSLFMIFL